MTPQFVLIVLFISVIIGFTKGGLTGLSLISVPLLSTVTSTAAEAVALVLTLLLVGDVFAVWAYWRKWDNRLLLLTLPFGVAGSIAGAYWLTQIPDAALRALIGVLTLVYVLYRLVGSRLQSIDYDPPAWVGVLAGLAAGITSSLANAGAPPLAAYLLLKRITPEVFVALFAIFFAVVNVVKLPFFIQSGLLQWDAFLGIIWAAPFIPLGVWLGRRFVRWVDPQVFEYAILLILFITGITLIGEILL